MVLLAAFVPHQFGPLPAMPPFVLAFTVAPRFSRLLPLLVAVFPASRLKKMFTVPAPIAPAATPPPVPVDELPVIVTFESVCVREGIAGFRNNPPPFVAPAPFWPFWFPLITVP